jgi:superfamily II DNA or RNA helicase
MTKTCTITVTDEVWCLISGLSPGEHEFLWNEFAKYVDGYFFMPSYKLGRFDGKIRFYQKTGKTYIRLLDKILPHIVETWGYDVQINDKRKVFESPSTVGSIEKVDETNGIATEATGLDLFGDTTETAGRKIELRPYQLQCINDAVTAGSGLIIAGTGAGKTLITAGISCVYGKMGYKIITVVPSADLVEQTRESYVAAGLDVGVYSGTEKDINHTHVVATWQSIQYNPSMMQEFQVFIWDECHSLKASVAQELINNNGKNTPFRFGVTGTFPKGDVDGLAINSSVGPILREIPAEWLIKMGYLSKLEIQPIETNETYIDEEFPDYASEKAFLSKSPARLEKIADLIISQCAEHSNTLVLVNSIQFGERLSALIKDSVFLYGESPSDLRKEHYDMFKDRDDLIVIASAGIAAQGISIDRVFCLMVVDAGKSFIKAIQSIGRGLRKGHDKDFVTVVDVYSKQKWAKKHFKLREKYYKEAKYPILKKQTLKVK